MARARRNIFKTLAMLSCCFIFCWTWNAIYFLLFHLGCPCVDLTSTFYVFTVVLVHCNCCINPFVYLIKYEQFQAEARRFLRLPEKRVHADGEGSTGTTANS